MEKKNLDNYKLYRIIKSNGEVINYNTKNGAMRAFEFGDRIQECTVTCTVDNESEGYDLNMFNKASLGTKFYASSNILGGDAVIKLLDADIIGEADACEWYRRKIMWGETVAPTDIVALKQWGVKLSDITTDNFNKVNVRKGVG